MKFGIGIRNRKTGADLYVMILQICSILPALYTFIASGYMGLFAKTNVFTVLSDFGLAAVPRWEALLLSALYRLTSKEVIVHFVLLGAALVFGLAANALMRPRSRFGRSARIVFAALIAADLVLRVLPFYFNIAFGWPAAVFGFAVRVACLVLVLLDLRADAKNRVSAEGEPGE